MKRRRFIASFAGPTVRGARARAGGVAAGKLTAIATAGAQRLPAAPMAPAFVEAAFPALVVTSWSLRAMPAGTPGRIEDRLRPATERALKEADVIESMKLGGFEPAALPVADTDAFIRAGHKRWGEVIRAAGIELR